mgnify:CR=1 FL=1
MTKFKFFLTLIACLVAFNANALTLEEKISKAEMSYNNRIEKIDTMKRASEAKKSLLKLHAKQNFDVKVKQIKDLDKLYTKEKSDKMKTKSFK